MRLGTRFQQRRVVFAGVPQTLVAERRDRREHADRLPVRLARTPPRAGATSPAPGPITRRPQFAANGVAPALLAVSDVSWLYPAYDGAAFKPIGTLTPKLTWKEPTLTASGSATARITPVIDVLINGIGGPRIDLNGSVALSSDDSLESHRRGPHFPGDAGVEHIGCQDRRRTARSGCGPKRARARAGRWAGPRASMRTLMARRSNDDGAPAPAWGAVITRAVDGLPRPWLVRPTVCRAPAR